jgi:hypothetical protein
MTVTRWRQRSIEIASARDASGQLQAIRTVALLRVMSLSSSVKSLPVSGPTCEKCGLPMLLSEIQSDQRKFEIHLFECPQCRAQEAHIVKKTNA